MTLGSLPFLSQNLTVPPTFSLHQGAAPCPGLNLAQGVHSEALWGYALGCQLQGAEVEVQALGAGQQGRSGWCPWQGAQPADIGRAMDIYCIWKWPAGWEDLEGSGEGDGGLETVTPGSLE